MADLQSEEDFHARVAAKGLTIREFAALIAHEPPPSFDVDLARSMARFISALGKALRLARSDLDGLPAAPILPVGPEKLPRSAHPFLPVFAPLLTLLCEQLAQVPCAVREGAMKYLLQSIDALASRTLVLKLNIARVPIGTGTLGGSGSC